MILRCLKHRPKFLFALSLSLGLSVSTVSSAGRINDLPPGYLSFYVPFLIHILGLSLSPRQTTRIINSYHSNQNLLDHEEVVLEQINSNFANYHDMMAETMLAYQESYANTQLTLVSNDNTRILVTWNEYQALLNFSEHISNFLPAVPFPNSEAIIVSVNLPGVFLSSLIRIVNPHHGFSNWVVSNTDSFSNDNQDNNAYNQISPLELAMRSHLRAFENFISYETTQQILVFITRVEELRGSFRLLFRLDDLEENELRDALLGLVEDYHNLLILANGNSSRQEIKRVLASIEKAQSRFARQRLALEYLRTELFTLAFEWNKKCYKSNTMSKQAIENAISSLERVQKFFRDSCDLMRKLECERYNINAIIKEMFDFKNDMDDLARDIADLKIAASEKQYSTDCFFKKLSTSCPEKGESEQETLKKTHSSCPELKSNKKERGKKKKNKKDKDGK